MTKIQHIHPSGIQTAQLPALTHSSLLWLCLGSSDFSWTLWSILKKPLSTEIFGVFHHFSWFDPPKSHSAQLSGTSQVWNQQHHKGRSSSEQEFGVWAHWKGQEWPGTLQGAPITHPEIGFHFHTGNFPQPSNLIKYPFPKWKICKCPKLHVSFHPQWERRWKGEVGKGQSSRLGEKQELEITLGIICYLFV